MESSSSSSSINLISDVYQGDTIMRDEDESLERSLPSISDNATKKPTKKRIWFNTIFDEGPEEILNWFEEHKEQFTRFAACTDIAPSTGKAHIHIACVMENPVNIVWWQNQLGFKNHYKWANQKDWNKIMNYTLGKGKDDSKNELKTVFINHNCYKETQIRSGTKAEFYKEFVKNPTTGTMLRLFETEKFASCISEIENCKKYIQLKNSTKQLRDTKRQVIWIWGIWGQGKSLLARKFFVQYQDRTGKPCRNMTLSNTAAQAGGLHGDEGCVLIDDIKMDKIQNQDLLNLMDQYPMTIDAKGTTVHWDPDFLFITCVHQAETIGTSFPKWQAEMGQLLRRITLEVYVDRREDHPDGKYYQVLNEWYTEEEMIQKVWSLQQ